MKAAVLTGVGADLEIRDDVQIAPPGPGEVRVRVAASGVCHSDLSVQNGTIPLPTPIVLGHEGAGVVEEVGEAVTTVATGDHVVLSFVPKCGVCEACLRGQPYICETSAMQAAGGLLDGTTRLTSDGAALHQMACLGTFGEVAIVPEISVVKIAPDVPLDIAALIGCGVLTGVGAALNTASIQPGDTVAVIGCGGVGLNVIQGARIAGAARIIAVDKFASKLDMAKQFGATDMVNPDDGDTVGQVMALTQKGVHVAFEAIGLEATITAAVDMLRPGGEAVIVGVPRMDVMLTFNAAFTFLYLNKSVKGCWYGSADVQRDVPKLIKLWQDGELKLDELISKEIQIEDVNGAFEAMESGEVARSVIRHSH
ncbi:Zn-dependent alcohol dehydrogenase [Iamia sp.]|jgi:S-(hydroxymethyl)glutathione dehydrogenase/alcohol dehydrogenase|uniref:Zn-dependent alcohol dehydrogenase n=1 Tax=Iamia sp. TaxID=2722710 RepID=UPI002C1AEDBC|nr:Zn-dependent alcohol dehydrogenase [Iamia sp.]HXH58781.1 Zn-dependent alcohol dehydrogenase [Iamia sp.]